MDNLNDKPLNEAQPRPSCLGGVTIRNFDENQICECDNVPTYRQNAFGIYVCGECDKKLKDKDISAIGSYYGW